MKKWLGTPLLFATLSFVGHANLAIAGSYQESELQNCSGLARVDVSEATCLTGAVTSETSTLGGTKYSAWAESACSAYGTIKAAIFRNQYSAEGHFVLDDATRQSLNDSSVTLAAIACCWSDSALCFKDQVEPDADGMITRRSREVSTSWEQKQDVSTAWKRYNYCSESPDEIYCTVDPSGDAKTQPDLGVPEGSSLKDCKDNYALSPAATSEDDVCAQLGVLRPSWKGDPDVPDDLRTDENYVLDNENCVVSGLSHCNINDVDYGSGGIPMRAGNLVKVSVQEVSDIRICSIDLYGGAITVNQGVVGDCP